MKSKIYALLGFSGSGKDTTMRTILERHDDLQNVVSWTTRPMRQGEQHGREYYFTNSNEFNSMYENGEFIEIREYFVANGDTWYYGFTTSELDEKLSRGNVVMIIDLDGFKEMKEIYKDKCIGVFLKVDLDTLIQRILNREELTWEVVSEAVRRLNDDKDRAFNGYEDWVDYVIDTDNSEFSVKKIEKIIYGE